MRDVTAGRRSAAAESRRSVSIDRCSNSTSSPAAPSTTTPGCGHAADDALPAGDANAAGNAIPAAVGAFTRDNSAGVCCGPSVPRGGPRWHAARLRGASRLRTGNGDPRGLASAAECANGASGRASLRPSPCRPAPPQSPESAVDVFAMHPRECSRRLGVCCMRGARPGTTASTAC